VVTGTCGWRGGDSGDAPVVRGAAGPLRVAVVWEETQRRHDMWLSQRTQQQRALGVPVVCDEEIRRHGGEEEPVMAQIPQLAQTRKEDGDGHRDARRSGGYVIRAWTREEDGDGAQSPQPTRGERGRTHACASGKGRG
jgi:hypothetical protein